MGKMMGFQKSETYPLKVRSLFFKKKNKIRKFHGNLFVPMLSTIPTTALNGMVRMPYALPSHHPLPA